MSNLAQAWDDLEVPGEAAKLADDWDSLPVEEPKKAKTEEKGEKPGVLTSFGAGVGETVGRGALAIQQIVGKGIQKLGDVFNPKQTTLSDLVVPKKENANFLQQSGTWLLKDASEGVKKLAAENAPYEEAHPISNLAGNVTGMILSPVNKLVPGGAAAKTVVGSATKGAAQGAALNALSSPVSDDNQFLLEKGQQAAIGGIGGTLGGISGFSFSKLLDKGIDFFRSAANKFTNTAGAAESTINDALSQSGVSAAALKAEKPELFSSLREQVDDALKTGKSVDPEALKRLVRAQTLPVPVPMLKGQITRDPMQFAKEQNLRGIQGVGEPITETLKSQNQALLSNLDEMGAKRGTDVVTAGKTAIEALKGYDKETSSAVGAAYKAFKEATGRELDVPLKGLAQDYAMTLKEFGDAIPSAIRSRFEELGLMSGTAQKTFSIGDAEGLIKSINKNYDPKNRVQANALDELRRSVQSAISGGAGASAEGTEAAGLALAARNSAKQRFSLIESTPALKAAISGAEPDKFVQKYILQGNVGEIKSLVDTLGKSDPKALSTLQDSLMQFIKERVGNLREEGNATFSSDQLKRFVNDPNTSQRLGQVLGPERMAQLRQLYQVSEDALYAPTASAVNRSNTASAAANIIKSEVQGGSMNAIADLLSKYVPVISGPAQAAKAANQSARAASMVNEAVNPSLAQTGANRLLPDFGAFPARSGAAALQERNRREAQR